jgi:integrase
MSKAKTPLTLSAINKLTCPSGRKSIQHPVDPQVPGLLIEVRYSGSKTYFLRYRDADQRTRYHKVARSMDLPLSAVKKEALRIRSGIVLGEYPNQQSNDPEPCPTWNQFFQDTYAPWAKSRKKSFTDDLKLHRNRLSPRYGDTPLALITLKDADSFLSELADEGLSSSSIRHNGQLLKRCLGLAEKWKIIKQSNLADLELPIVRDAREYFLSDTELQRLIYVLESDPNRGPADAAKLLLLTGLRVGELLRCSWQDLELESSTPTLQVIKEHSKNGKTRYVPLSDEALKLINQLPSKGKSEHLFINSRNGSRLQSIDKAWQRMREKAGLPKLRLHDLRHNFASMAVSSGESLYSVQKLLGHSSPSLSTRYSHISDSTLNSAANSVSGYLDKALNKKGSSGK